MSAKMVEYIGTQIHGHGCQRSLCHSKSTFCRGNTGFPGKRSKDLYYGLSGMLFHRGTRNNCLADTFWDVSYVLVTAILY